MVQSYIAAMPGWKQGVGQRDVRYLHIDEDGLFDAGQFADWLRQASRLPGVRM